MAYTTMVPCSCPGENLQQGIDTNENDGQSTLTNETATPPSKRRLIHNDISNKRRFPLSCAPPVLLLVVFTLTVCVVRHSEKIRAMKVLHLADLSNARIHETEEQLRVIDKSAFKLYERLHEISAKMNRTLDQAIKEIQPQNNLTTTGSVMVTFAVTTSRDEPLEDAARCVVSDAYQYERVKGVPIRARLICLTSTGASESVPAKLLVAVGCSSRLHSSVERPPTGSIHVALLNRDYSELTSWRVRLTTVLGCRDQSLSSYYPHLRWDHEFTLDVRDTQKALAGDKIHLNLDMEQ